MTPKELTKGKWAQARESLIRECTWTHGSNTSEMKVIKTSYIANIYGTRSTRSCHIATYNCSRKPVLKQRQTLNPDDSQNYGRIEINHCQLLKSRRRCLKPACPQEEPGSVGKGFTINTLNPPCKELYANYLDTGILVLGHSQFVYTCLGACGYESVRDWNQLRFKICSSFFSMRFYTELHSGYSVGILFLQGSLDFPQSAKDMYTAISNVTFACVITTSEIKCSVYQNMWSSLVLICKRKSAF